MEARVRLRSRRCLARALLWLCAALPGSVPLSAQESWQIESWSSTSGTSTDSFNQVVPLQDGHLLLSSFYAPPVRFDGRSFSPLRLTGPDAAQLWGSTCVAQTADGRLWFGTRERGLLRVDAHGVVQRVGLGEGSGRSDVAALSVSRTGRLHVGTRAGLLELDTSVEPPRIQELTDASVAVSALFESASGELWIGSERGLWQRGGGEMRRIEHPSLDAHVWSIAEDARGDVWIGTRGNGLARLSQGRWSVFDVRGGFPNDVVRHVLPGVDGSLWVATSGGGIARLRDGTLEQVLDSDRGLDGDSFFWLYQDTARALWAVGPGTGLHRVRPSAFQGWGTPRGLASAFVWTIHEDAAGTLWIGANGGLSRMRGERLERVGAPGPGQQAVVRTLLADDEDALLVGTEGGLFRWRETFTLFPASRDRPVMALVRDRAGQRWAAGAALWRIDGDALQEMPAFPWQDGSRVVALYPQADGGLEAVTQHAGVWRFHAGSWTQLVDAGGESLRDQWIDADGRRWLVGAGITWVDADGTLRALAGLQERSQRGFHAMLDDGVGGVWLPSNVGLFRFESDALRRFAAGQQPEPVPQRFDRSDGLRSTEFNGGSQAPAIRDRRGRLWFATSNGLTRVDPRRVVDAPADLKLAITGVDTDEASLAPIHATQLSPGTRRVAVHYTALPASVGGKARFSYRLLPLFTSWVDVGDARSALFPGLVPGDYRFELRAAVPGLDAAPQQTAFAFSIAPHFWQRAVVQWGAAALLLLAAAALPAAHIRALRAQRRRLLDEVADKTRELESLAATDALTGLANRRSFDRRLAQMLERSTPALLVLDIDHFKRYNDARGHAAGDACLRAVAEVLAGSVRHEDDVVARLGGEEFAVLLSDARGASALGERIRSQLRARQLRHPDSPAGEWVTLSIGCARARPGDSPDALYRRADDALYRAKQSGRDRVVDAEQ